MQGNRELSEDSKEEHTTEDDLLQEKKTLENVSLYLMEGGGDSVY